VEATTLTPYLTVAAGLDLEDKVRLLTGAAGFRLHALPAAGLRSMTLSDGPVGVRGTGDIPDATSLLMPSPSALAATWDIAAARRAGRLFASEARRLDVDVVLAPQVNIQRTPVGGRHFECYSEDPYLTGHIGGAVVESMQAAGVGACVKHYVANDSETARTEYVSTVGEQALREVYLAPFERIVREVGAWAVMAAYNKVDDGTESAPMTEHRHLVNEVLKDEWGFDGVVMSDWMAAQSTVATALGGLDLVMPGPGGPWEEHLLAAVRAGDVPESVIDNKVARLLLLAERVGGYGDMPHLPADADADALFLRTLAATATVTLRRERDFVVDPTTVKTIALIGPNAESAYVMGGGSSFVNPHYVVSPLEGLRAAFPHAEITTHRGGSALVHTPLADFSEGWADPETGKPGVAVIQLDAQGNEVSRAVDPAWTGWLRDPDPQVATVVLEADAHLSEPGEHLIEVGTVGLFTLELGGTEVARGSDSAGYESVLDSSATAPVGRGSSITVIDPVTVRVRATLQVVDAGGFGTFARGEIRHAPPAPSIDEEIAQAVAAASAADVVVVVVGTNADVESEGFDRTSIELPGRQNDLVAQVLKVAPDAIISVNAGAPVLLPWLEKARTVLWSWFPGQECGHALADVITGVTEPAGRLPWTLPARAEDVPVKDALPGADMTLHYDDGVHVGYRGWFKAGLEPARPFGFGLGWTDWEYGRVGPAVVNADGSVAVEVDITNIGKRTGTEVVQFYLKPPADAGEPAYDRPVRWLAGFARATVEPGATATVTAMVPRRAFEVWDVAAQEWVLPGGTYALCMGRSARDLHCLAQVVR